MDELKPAASYARISQKVERDKVADQHKQNEEYAARTGRCIVAYYTDDGIGALGNKVRPDFERMLADAPTAEWRVIIATEEERLARNVTEKMELHAACEDSGVTWDTIRDGYVDPSTDSGEFMSTIRAAVGRIESRRKTRRQRAASDVRAAEGAPTARPGYGYRREAGRDVVDPIEAETIRRAVRYVLDGESLRAVCKRLDAEQTPTPGNATRWNSTILKQLLLRPSLAGLRTHRGVVVGDFDPELHTPIISRDEHERLAAMLKDPSRKAQYVGRAPKYLLSGIAICGKCGAKMKRAPGRMTTTKSGTKRQPPSYSCLECYGLRRKQDLVDALVEGVVLGRLQMPDAAQLFTHGDPVALQEARDTIEAIDARLSNAADLFATGGIDAAQLARITERLRGDREKATAAMEAALPAAIPADLIGADVQRVWGGLSMDVKRTVLDTLVTVTILPSGSGKDFDPDTVQVRWKG